MLALLGFAMIATFMLLIMTRVLAAAVALVLIPIVFGLMAGHGADMAGMAIEGLSELAPIAVALVFAVLYFAIMIDAGLFDPLVRAAVRFAKGDPLRVTMATATVATLVALDGDGATVALVTIGAFLPLYRRLGMNPLIIAVLLSPAALSGFTPWGGPLARASAALNVEMTDVFFPLIPTLIAGLVTVFLIAWFLGMSERKRLGIVSLEADTTDSLFERPPGIDRPHLLWVNFALTLALIIAIIVQLIPLPIAFMIGFSLALVINYPKVSQQRDRIAAHAANALPIVILIFSAAIFTGILEGTGMVQAMAQGLVNVLPEHMGRYFGPIVAIAGGPLTFIMSNDAYYFGIVPVLAETAGHYGVEPVEVARASLLGLTIHSLSPLIAAIYLVAGLLKVEVGELQRFGLPFALLIFFVLIATALLTGAVPIVSGA
jgi:CitMHS family citrate-Mg2+:H+ or citrate-Ca2+:H+ symporter